jgi:hypothetical protein
VLLSSSVQTLFHPLSACVAQRQASSEARGQREACTAGRLTDLFRDHEAAAYKTVSVKDARDLEWRCAGDAPIPSEPDTASARPIYLSRCQCSPWLRSARWRRTFPPSSTVQQVTGTWNATAVLLCWMCECAGGAEGVRRGGRWLDAAWGRLSIWRRRR